MCKRGKNYIKINPSGWVNSKFPICHKEKSYKIPYSSHSNFPELEKFVASIRPSVLKGIVPRSHGNIEKINGVKHFHQYSWCLRNIKQRGHALFVQKFVDFESRSEAFRDLQSTDKRRSVFEVLAIHTLTDQLHQDDTRVYRSKTFAQLDREDENFEDGPLPEFRVEEKKEKTVNMKINRMIKQANKDLEKENRMIKGTEKRPIDSNRLLTTLFDARLAKVEFESSSRLPTVGDSIRHVMEANLSRDVDRFLPSDAGRAKRKASKRELIEDRPAMSVKHRAKR